MLLRLRTPAVSMTMYVRPSFSMRTSTASRVVPGISETMTRSAPASELMNVLLPALRLPTTAIFMATWAGASAVSAGRRDTMAAASSYRPRECLALTGMTG